RRRRVRILAERARVGVERLLAVADLGRLQLADAEQQVHAARLRLLATQLDLVHLDEPRPLLGPLVDRLEDGRRPQLVLLVGEARAPGVAAWRSGLSRSMSIAPSTSLGSCSPSCPSRYFSSTMAPLSPGGTSLSSRRITGDSSFHCCVCT